MFFYFQNPPCLLFAKILQRFQISSINATMANLLCFCINLLLDANQVAGLMFGYTSSLQLQAIVYKPSMVIFLYSPAVSRGGVGTIL